MKSFYYIVHREHGGPSVTFRSREEVFAFLKNAGLVSVFRYNDDKTGRMFAKAADEHCLSVEEQERRPVFITTVLDGDGAFVESEAFWTENYLLDEFYNPDLRPYIERVSRGSE